MHVVEHVSDKTLGTDWRVRNVDIGFAGKIIPGGLDLGVRFRSRLLYVELSNDLRLALVEDLKVLLVKITDCMSLGVADYRAHHHQLYIHLEGSGFVVGGDSC